jgi:hypothetical protein
MPCSYACKYAALTTAADDHYGGDQCCRGSARCHHDFIPSSVCSISTPEEESIAIQAAIEKQEANANQEAIVGYFLSSPNLGG